MLSRIVAENRLLSKEKKAAKASLLQKLKLCFDFFFSCGNQTNHKTIAKPSNPFESDPKTVKGGFMGSSNVPQNEMFISSSKDAVQTDRDILLGLNENSSERKDYSDNVFIRNCFLLTSKLDREMKDNIDLEIDQEDEEILLEEEAHELGL